MLAPCQERFPASQEENKLSEADMLHSLLYTSILDSWPKPHLSISNCLLQCDPRMPHVSARV